jgi:DNA polymerase III delta prime subunit
MYFKNYAPKNLNDVIYPNEAVRLRMQAYADGSLNGNLLLHGPNGTGKTTLANLLPSLISGSGAFIESRTADELIQTKNLTDYVRNAINMSGIWDGGQYYWILNEFDCVAGKTEKLWNVMDQFGDMLRVIITTNEPMNVHKSIRSRCMEVHMPAVTPAAMFARADLLLKQEGLSLHDDQLMHYLKSKEHYCDIRKYGQVLDELLFLHKSGQPMPPWKAPVQAPAIAPKLRVL